MIINGTKGSSKAYTGTEQTDLTIYLFKRHHYGTDNVDDALQGCLDFGGIDFLYALSKVKTKQYMEEFVKKRDIIGFPLSLIGDCDRDTEFTIIESKKETESSYKLIATLATGASKIPVVCYAVDDDETRGLKKGDKVKFFGGGT